MAGGIGEEGGEEAAGDCQIEAGGADEAAEGLGDLMGGLLLIASSSLTEYVSSIYYYLQSRSEGGN